MQQGDVDPFGFGAVTPVVPAVDVGAAIAFYVERLGFVEVFRSDDNGLVRCGAASVMFFACDKREIAEWTAFRIGVEAVDELYARCVREAIVHPNGALERKPWGNREFTVIDPSGVGITFWSAA